ncbi:MAG: hypothetical protein IPP31_04835 [Chitinophagaceae bacterium]|nr:hypothetical protein [Chitinophagaceae bacterium]
MNHNQLFDKHIKDRLGDYSPPVDPRIWDRIVEQREKRKPVGFWFALLSNRRNLLLIAALLIAGGSGALYLIKRSSTNQVPQIAAVKPSNSPDQNTARSSNNNNPENNSIETPVTVNPANDPASASTDLTPGINTLTPSGNTPSGPTVGTEADKQTASSWINKRTARTAGNTRISAIAGGLAEDPTRVLQDPAVDEIPVGGTLISRLNFFAQRITAGKNTTGEPVLRLSPFNYLPDCPSLERNASGNKKYLEFYAGPDYAFRSLKDTGNSAYLQKRKESTKFTSAYSAGIRYTRVFRNSMSIRVGANYSQINEKFTFMQGGLIQVTYIINANGDTTGSYITTGTRYKTTHNRYRSVDVPLMLGYELGNSKLHVNINAGAVVNVYSWQSGEVLDTAYRPVNITTGKGSSPYQFKTNAGVGFMGAVSVYYKLTDKIHILAEPYYRHSFTPMNKENLTLKQKYNTAGLRLGLRIDLR